MIFDNFPQTIEGVDLQHWETYEPYYSDLQQRPLDAANLQQWMRDWSDLNRLIREANADIYNKKAVNTADKAAEQAFLDFIQDVQPRAAVADQRLIERFLSMNPEARGLSDMDVTIHKMRNQADLFREENVPLSTRVAELGNEYDKITGAMTVDWDGEEKNLSQLEAMLRRRERDVRERSWRQMLGLWHGQRERLDELYMEMLALRVQIARNAGLPDFREYAFRGYDRFDYTPEDCLTFHEAIEAVVVPLASKIYEQRRVDLGLATLRPWDVDVDASGAAPLAPYDGQDDLTSHTLNIVDKVDPELARYYATMAEEGLMDLDTRSGKALGGYCSTLPLRRRPFIFMNGTGTQNDVQTMMHEAGHAFHVFEAAELPYVWQIEPPMEFAEVASTGMELLTAPFLDAANGGFYSASETARARIEHLESIVLFLPYMAVVDAFQHWVYTHADEAADPANCDAAWGRLYQRFMPDIDYSELEEERISGWHRKLHIFHVPFYYIEYGIAQIGSLQVWRNALKDRESAVAAYRQALALGGTRSLPQLFEVAGAEFRFDIEMLHDLMAIIEDELAVLREQL